MYEKRYLVFGSIDEFVQLTMLKPTTESISLRLPSYLLRNLKQLVNAKDVPYQSLLKVYLAERLKKNFGINGQSESIYPQDLGGNSSLFVDISLN